MTKNENKEFRIQKSIYKHIDDFNCFIFNAGAGAGKTYSLIETLKYVIVNKVNKQQKVACITYTNVAVNEIKSRLGNTDNIHVSTIHERLWDLIKQAQPELLILHKKKINDVINENDNKLKLSEKAVFFDNLEENEKEEFIDFILKRKEIFYNNYSLPANKFREAYDSELNKPHFLNKCLKSIANFKYVVNIIYNIDLLNNCLEKIKKNEENGNNKANHVIYDSKINSNRLHRMTFSHDTLIEYGLELVESYPMLCRIIIDTYPYFFIDEYQDTNINVIKLLKKLNNYAVENNKNWMVGYFGDVAQSIYDGGVGNRIHSYHAGLLEVNKVFNRRSHTQIINCANKIRNDKIIQKPIYDDRNQGSVIFYQSNATNKIEAVEKFISDFKSDISYGDDHIDCLILTNKLMCIFNQFERVYSVFSESNIYYDDLNTKVLSHELEKLNPTILMIYQFVKIYKDLLDNKVSYYDFFGKEAKGMTFKSASSLVAHLSSGKVKSLKDWLNFIFKVLLKKEHKVSLRMLLINRLSFENENMVSANQFRSYFMSAVNDLMFHSDEDKLKKSVNELLNLDMDSLIHWVDFIDGVESNDVSYHTYHGTKGEEYNNVAIILEHSFGTKNKDKFKDFFNIIQNCNQGESVKLDNNDENEKFLNTRNLLYVACSRAIKNLRILYLDDISDIEKGIESIFGEIHYL